MKIFGTCLLIVTLLGLPVLLLFEFIDLTLFVAIGSFWLIGSFVALMGPETISEVTLWKASIKRDVKAAREIRDEVESVREELRSVTKMVVENSYITASCSFMAMGSDQVAKEKLEENFKGLSKFFEPNSEKNDEFWQGLKELFSYRDSDVGSDSQKKG